MSKTCLHIHTVFAEEFENGSILFTSQALEVVQVLLAVLRS